MAHSATPNQSHRKQKTQSQSRPYKQFRTQKTEQKQQNTTHKSTNKKTNPKKYRHSHTNLPFPYITQQMQVQLREKLIIEFRLSY